MYEVFSISGHYVLHDGSKSLWCSKLDGTLVPSNSTVLDESLEPVCLGTCHGVVGKIKFLPESPDNLVLISDIHFVCQHNDASVYRINNIVMLPLSLETPCLDLPSCPIHQKPPKGEKAADTDAKIERKLEDEFVKWFERSFYYTEEGGDITHNLTELTSPNWLGASNDTSSEQYKNHLQGNKVPSWQRAKTEYFWNRAMLECLISVRPQFPENCDPWLVPIMQGYVEQASVAVPDDQADDITVYVTGADTTHDVTREAPCDPAGDRGATLTIISRRSKYRAGTRFKRRGIDENGHPANFVETEQILSFGSQRLSYTIIRGSAPVYWYQPLTNYRPKPVILRTPEEALTAFQQHMDHLIASHHKVVIVNLLDSSGKEASLGDEYAKVAYMYNNEHLTYIAFDFNEYCAGMKFDNVNVLLKELSSISDNFGFTHVVDGGVMQKQEGAIRVNCMDSLDRTNVVQGAIAGHCLLNQAAALDIPVEEMSAPAKLLWANNGDAISTQYAGTAALKGDYTRTGERGVAGMMRDGVSSMTRMYINVFRDTNRQAAIDIMHGLEPDLAEIREEKSEELDCIPRLVEAATELLPTHADVTVHSIYKSWITQEWPSGESKAVWLTPKSLSVVHSREQLDTLPLSNCDRIHIGQPPDCLGHYLRIVVGKTSFTLRPLTLERHRLKDVLMKMAHCIVSCRDDLGLTTQVLHGPLNKSDIVDLGIDKIKCSANSFGTRIAAGAKRMMGEARGVLDTTKSVDSGVGSSVSSQGMSSPRSSPKFGRKMFNLFRREEVDNSLPTVRLSDLSDRPGFTPDCTPDYIPDLTPDCTPDYTPDLTPDCTPDYTPDLTPDCTSDTMTSLELSESRDYVSTSLPVTLLQLRDDAVTKLQSREEAVTAQESNDELMTLSQHSYSETNLDKIPKEEWSGTFRKNRAATFDTMNSAMHSKSNFIFIDRLAEDSNFVPSNI